MTIENICCSRPFCFMLALLLLPILFLDCHAQQRREMDLDKFLEVWNSYVGYPSSENANKVSNLLPDSGHVRFTNSRQAEAVFDSVRSKLDLLAYQVYTGDTSAARLAFRLYSIADGAFGEELDVVLGRLIRINPILFLRELKSNYRIVPGLDGLLGNTGNQYYGIESHESNAFEMSLRLEALKKVTDPDLIKVRDECIKVLEGMLVKSEN